MFTWAVLRNALGSGSSIKRGGGVDPLSKAAAKTGHGCQIAAVNIAHSDSGLFGILVSADGDTAKAVSSLLTPLTHPYPYGAVAQAT